MPEMYVWLAVVVVFGVADVLVFFIPVVLIADGDESADGVADVVVAAVEAVFFVRVVCFVTGFVAAVAAGVVDASVEVVAAVESVVAVFFELVDFVLPVLPVFALAVAGVASAVPVVPVAVGVAAAVFFFFDVDFLVVFFAALGPVVVVSWALMLNEAKANMESAITTIENLVETELLLKNRAFILSPFFRNVIRNKIRQWES